MQSHFISSLTATICIVAKAMSISDIFQTLHSPTGFLWTIGAGNMCTKKKLMKCSAFNVKSKALHLPHNKNNMILIKDGKIESVTFTYRLYAVLYSKVMFEVVYVHGLLKLEDPISESFSCPKGQHV